MRRSNPPRRRYGRRGTNWLPALAGLVALVALVAMAGLVVVTHPDPAPWMPAPVVRSMLLLERL